MTKTRFRFFRSFIVQFIGLTMCSMAIGSMPQPAPAADDSYLKALEAEADNTAKVNKRPTKKAKTVAKKVDRNTKFRENFEQTLASERPATFTFYRKLPENDKASVLATYQESKKISTTSKKIFDLYFRLHKK